MTNQSYLNFLTIFSLFSCLSTNNFIGLLGMLTTLLLKIYVPREIFEQYTQWDCVGKVIWRFFGLSSGCIAAVMAIERWMALARPFIYHKVSVHKDFQSNNEWNEMSRIVLNFMFSLKHIVQIFLCLYSVCHLAHYIWIGA